MNITGVILDTSNDTEMTGFIHIGQKTLIEHQVNELKKICKEVILVTSHPSHYLPLLGNSSRMITNYFKGSQRLSALHAALSLSKNDWLWVVTSDMPFLSADAILFMYTFKKEGLQLITSEYNGSIQPFHSLYERSCADITNQLLEQENASIMSLLEKVNFKVIDNEKFEAIKIDKPFQLRVKSFEDYQEAKRNSQNDSIISM
ncbi:molybdenum cofactor guanylyltransferase [Halalkalibacter urbisdiaboli]|uniref:molybdenum cofactor guanylyltransferase n=1 Tax=Halalkalibacter urbisdiaboli TaxID=1960589 RepID=UPI000B4471B8|nr:molybdenum cofactor guanylyltransferase [Halalkalibacter urbisdiaboli]